MQENLEEFKKNVKISFQKAKEDINSLHNKLDDLTNLLSSILAQNNPETAINTPNSILEPVQPQKTEGTTEKGQKMPSFEEKKSSSGNDGVYSFIHSFNRHSTVIYSDTKLFLSKLTKQELLTYLTLFQLEEESKVVTYIDLATKINLSEGCIRTYISSLIKKGAPLIKQKYNNKTVVLLIPQDFRDLRPKQLIIDYYYRNDPNQRKLVEDSIK